MDPIDNLTVLALALLLVTLIVPTWLLLPSAAHAWGNVDADRLEMEIVPAPTPPSAKPGDASKATVAPAKFRATPELVPVPRWDFYLADGFRDGCKALDSGLQSVAPPEDALRQQLDWWAQETVPVRPRIVGPYTFWDAYFWAVGIRRAFVLTTSLDASLEWRSQLLHAWDGPLRQLIIEKLTEAPPVPDPAKEPDGLWPPEAVARPEPAPTPEDGGPGAAA